MVSVTLNSAGGKRMFDFTSENVGRGMAVVFVERTPEVRMVDGKEVRTARITEEVVSVATIRGVFDKQFQTTGLDSIKEARSEEHTSELQSLMRISYAVFCLKKKKKNKHIVIMQYEEKH